MGHPYKKAVRNWDIMKAFPKKNVVSLSSYSFKLLLDRDTFYWFF